MALQRVGNTLKRQIPKTGGPRQLSLRGNERERHTLSRETERERERGEGERAI